MVYSDCSWQDSYFLVVSTGTTVGAGVKIGIAVEVGVIVGTEVGDTEDDEVPAGLASVMVLFRVGATFARSCTSVAPIVASA